jgi:hypothetical protein
MCTRVDECDIDETEDENDEVHHILPSGTIIALNVLNSKIIPVTSLSFDAMRYITMNEIRDFSSFIDNLRDQHRIPTFLKFISSITCLVLFIFWIIGKFSIFLYFQSYFVFFSFSACFNKESLEKGTPFYFLLGIAFSVAFRISIMIYFQRKFSLELERFLQVQNENIYSRRNCFWYGSFILF